MSDDHYQAGQGVGLMLGLLCGVLAELAGVEPEEFMQLLAKKDAAIYQPQPMPVVVVSDLRLAPREEVTADGSTT